MANIPDSNDPYRPTPVEDDPRSPRRFDSELQADPELAEGPAGGGRIAAYTLGAAILLGIVFYGLNQNSMTTATSTAPVTQDTVQKAPAPTNNIADSDSSKPPLPPGVRDVTPRNNDAPGVTTGAAPSRPQPPQSAPTGTEVDSSKAGAAK